MTKFNKNKLWGLFIVIPIAFALIFSPMVFAEGENVTDKSDVKTTQNSDAGAPKLKNAQNADSNAPKDEVRQKKDDDPVTQKELNTRTQEIEGKINTKVSEAKQSVEAKLPDENLLIAALAVAGVAFAMSIAGIFLVGKSNGSMKKLAGTNHRIHELESEIEELKRKIYELEASKQVSPAIYAAQSQPVEISRPAPKRVEAAHTPPPIDPVAEFLNEYHKLNGMNPYESKEYRKNLISRHRLKAFACANSAERMQNPSISPIYADADAVKAHVWAFQKSDGNFAVVPRLPQTYDESLHDPGSMGMIFDSNFMSGKTYSKIEVIEPAVFADGWRLIKKGKIRLS